MVDLSKCYLHSIGNGYADNINAGEKLESILTSGGIYSRKLQLQQFKRNFYKIESTNWNESDYISISKVNDINNRLNSNTYKLFHYRQYSIIISNEIEHDLSFREGDYNHLDNELQVIDNIPTKYLIGLMMPHIYERAEFLLEVLGENNLDDLELIKLFEIWFKDSEYMYKVISTTGVPFKIYNEDTGFEVPTLKSELEFIRKIRANNSNNKILQK